MSDEGFFNSRTGTYVSSTRAHQRVGETISGYEKAISKSTGNFYMRPAAFHGSSEAFSPLLETAIAELEVQAMEQCALARTRAMESLTESLEEARRNLELNAAEDKIRRTYETVLKNACSFQAIDELQSSSNALDAMLALIPNDQVELCLATKNLDIIKRSCRYVLGTLDKTKSKLRDLDDKRDSVLESEKAKERAEEQYFELDSIRTSRIEAFEAMRESSASAEERASAIETFWETIDIELRAVDEDTWKQKKFDEACQLAERSSYERAIEILSVLDDYPGAAEKHSEVVNAFTEFKNSEKYKNAEKKMRKGRYREAIKCFRELGSWRDAKERLAYAESKYKLWREETYCYAVKYFSDEEYDEAAKHFSKLGNFSDSKAQLEESRRLAKLTADYKVAIEIELSGDYGGARNAFTKLGLFRDSPERAESCRIEFERRQKQHYETAIQNLADGHFADSIAHLEELGNYLDSKELLNKARLCLKQEETMRKAVSYFASEQFSRAKSELTMSYMQEVYAAQMMLETIVEIEQKNQLIASLTEKEKDLEQECDSRQKEYNKIAMMARPNVPALVLFEKTEEKISSLEIQLKNTGFFNFGEKMRLRTELEKEQSKLPQLLERISKEQAQEAADIAADLNSIQISIDEIKLNLQAVKQSRDDARKDLRFLKSKY